uniref:Putative ribonuclease H-like domain-containing protein n=1 Tax=Tanacetum cinerariifolium TaxID=118510 RepID=A0A6L2N4V4_TANCI|nr:putative ribonuclease H-like domain-containing protein [Tanacetum cinerariifolium]
MIEAARTMLANAKLPVTFRAEAVNTACYVQNRVLVNKSHYKTPYELFNGRSPAIGFLKPFGCHVMILNTLDNLVKFEEKGDEGYFIRYSMSSKAFRVFNKRTRRVEENFHVEFLENKAIEKGSGPNWLFDINSLTKSMNYVPVDAGTIFTNLLGTKDAASQEVKKNVSSIRYIALPNWAHDALLEFSSSKPQDHCSTKVPEGSGNPNPTASTINPPADQMETLTVETPIPTTPSLDNILSLTNRFEDILRATTNSDESNGVEADISNIETTITASPTPTLGIHKDHPKSQIIGPVDTPIQTRNKSKEMDVMSAFLYGTIDEEVYVMKPPGFQDPEFPAKVYKVEKAMYGLHQAPRAWYGTLSKYLLKNGFQRGTIDQTLFIKKQREEFEPLMHEKFQMSAMGELNFFLGLKVLQKEDGIFLSQDKYVGDILKKFRYSDARSSNTPMEKENPWGKDETGKDVDLHLYRSMIGSLMYLTASRPDIMFAVCACARHQVTHKECHLHAVKRIFRYLKGHPKLGLWYSKESPFNLVAYSDSDYGGATQDHKSTTGGCQFLGRRLISWQCKKQTIIATSTNEAEYVAAASCCGQVLWIQNQLLDYGDCFEKKLINVDHIHTDENVADLLTKPFDAGRFQYLVVEHAIRGFVKGILNIYTSFSEHNADFHPMVDFIEASPLRRNLKIQDEEGISSLPDTELFENLTLMGYNISLNQKFTFQKGQFSHQWKYLIHNIMQCISPKSIGFNEFSSNIATALVCLATNRTYNSSKMIFDGLVKNVNNKGEGSGKPTESHHTPSPEAQSQSHTTYTLPSLPPSSALPTVADEPASPQRDVSQGEACPTNSGFIADQDRATIDKSSTLPHDSAPQVTSPVVDEEVEINRLKERVKMLEDREGVASTRSRDDAPIKGRSMDEGEATTERISDDSEEMATVLTFMDAATVLASGVVDVPTGSGAIPTASTPVEEQVPTGSEVVPTASLVFATATVVTPYKRRKARLVSKRVAHKEESPSLDDILSLTNKFDDILGVSTSSDEIIGVEADVSNMETSISASPTPTLRIYKDHPKSQIIGPVDTPIQTRHKSKMVE